MRSAALRDRTWVTRQGVYVDRIASAWLIRRFIDPQARFKFVSGKGYRPQAGELRFDMFEAEFTHEGDKCTFEVLLERGALKDPALRAIAEIIHDIDLKDDKFGRTEVAGIRTLVEGISIATEDELGTDCARHRGLQQSLRLFQEEAAIAESPAPAGTKRGTAR